MKNSYYYILLCIISTLIFAFTLWKKKDKKLVALYFFSGGLTYLLEYLTLVIFDGYVYNPGILSNPYFDNILGAVVSDAFTIPMIAVFIAGFKMNLKKIILIALLISVIEVIFVRLNLYRHNWWTYYYTFAGAVVFYYFYQKLLVVLRGRLSRTVHCITLFLSNLLIQASAVFVLAGILNLYFYNVPWFGNPSRGHVAFATIYIILITILFVLIVAFRLKWYWAFIGILLPSLSDLMLLRTNILIMSDSWSLLNFLIFRIIIFICIWLFNMYILTENNEGEIGKEYI